MQARVIAIAALLLLLLAPRAGATTPAQELEEARALFRAREFKQAIPQLNYLLYPTPRLSQPDDLVEAHVLLGVCAFESGDPKTARREFEEALFLDDTITLDTLLYSASAVEFFDDVKKDLAERARREEEARKLAEQNEALQKALASMLVVEQHPFYLNLIPFGTGQFQNGDKNKALFFAVSEGLTGGASAGLFLYITGEYGFRAKIEPREARTARFLQQLEIGTGSICIGLMIWGVVDAILNWEPEVRGKADESYLKLLNPTITPENGGATLSLKWEL